MITLLEGDGVFQWETAVPHEKLELRPWKARPLLIPPNISFLCLHVVEKYHSRQIRVFLSSGAQG